MQEWLKDHRLFGATLEELAGQLAALQPQQRARPSSGKRPAGPRASGSGGGSSDGSKELMARLLERAPSERLRAYAEGRLPAGPLQRTLPEQLDQNLRLLTILAAEMRALVQQLEQLADAAAGGAVAAAVGGLNTDEVSSGTRAAAAGDAAAADDEPSSSAGAAAAGAAAASKASSSAGAGAARELDLEEALLLAAVADGAARETRMIVSWQGSGDLFACRPAGDGVPQLPGMDATATAIDGVPCATAHHPLWLAEQGGSRHHPDDAPRGGVSCGHRGPAGALPQQHPAGSGPGGASRG